MSGLYTMRRFVSREVWKLHILDLAWLDCVLLRAVTLHGDVLTIGEYTNVEDAERDKQRLQIFLNKGDTT